MKLLGSKRAHIICSECQRESPIFRAFLYNDEDGEQWDGKEPEGWVVDEEALLEEDGIIVGSCPEHSAVERRSSNEVPTVENS